MVTITSSNHKSPKDQRISGVISEISPVLDILSEEEYTLISDYYSTEYGSKSELAQKYGLTLTQLYKRVHTIKEKVKSNKNITKI
jgi:DNA-binding NtrC family response regulator